MLFSARKSVVGQTKRKLNTVDNVEDCSNAKSLKTSIEKEGSPEKTATDHKTKQDSSEKQQVPSEKMDVASVPGIKSPGIKQDTPPLDEPKQDNIKAPLEKEEPKVKQEDPESSTSEKETIKSSEPKKKKPAQSSFFGMLFFSFNEMLNNCSVFVTTVSKKNIYSGK